MGGLGSGRKPKYGTSIGRSSGGGKPINYKKLSELTDKKHKTKEEKAKIRYFGK